MNQGLRYVTVSGSLWFL